MYDDSGDNPIEKPSDPMRRAMEMATDFRIHAEIAAVFEGVRKFDSQIITDLNPNTARDIQRLMGTFDKSRNPDSPILPPSTAAQAAELLNMPVESDLPTHHYHVHRRPGEVMIVRWLAGDEVELFYQRLQAHFDAALNFYRDEERQSNAWKKGPETNTFLDILDQLTVNLEERYLRDLIRRDGVFVLSTQTADEMDISYLAEQVMGVSAMELVGENNAPPDNPSEKDRAWFYKLFLLRGVHEMIEQMCFFTFLQKSDDQW